MVIEPTEQPQSIIVEPSVSGCYGNGWRQLWKNFWMLLLGGVIYVAISWGISMVISLPFGFGVMGMMGGMEMNFTPDATFYGAYAGYYVLNSCIQLFILMHLMCGMGYLFLNAARGTGVQIDDLFKGFRNYWSIVRATLLCFLIFGVPYGIMFAIMLAVPEAGFFLVPVFLIFIIIIQCKLAFVLFLLVDRQMKAWEAFKTSWNWTNGYAGKIFIICLLWLPIGFAGFICLVIGVIPAMMWVYMALASMYHAVSLRKDYKPPTPELLPG